MALYRIGEDSPRLADGVWVADSAQVIGRVDLGPKANVWFGSVLRGDNEWLTIGARCNVQDACVLHSDPGFPLVLEDDVSVGHQAMLHGCTIGAGSLVGIQAVVLNGARIGKGCLVGSGAVVTEGKEFPDGMLILGAPAKAVRPLEPQQVERLRLTAMHYVEKAARYRAHLHRID